MKDAEADESEFFFKIYTQDIKDIKTSCLFSFTVSRQAGKSASDHHFNLRNTNENRSRNKANNTKFTCYLNTKFTCYLSGLGS